MQTRFVWSGLFQLQRNNRLWDNWERDACIRSVSSSLPPFNLFPRSFDYVRTRSQIHRHLGHERETTYRSEILDRCLFEVPRVEGTGIYRNVQGESIRLVPLRLDEWCLMLTAMGSDRRSPRNKDGGKSMRRMCDRRRVFCGSEKWNWNGHSLV